MQQDGMLKARAELCERIDGLRAAIANGSIAGLCDKASDVRHLAQRYQLRPVADLAWKLEGRLARGERGPSVIDMLSLMREVSENGRAAPHAASSSVAAASARVM